MADSTISDVYYLNILNSSSTTNKKEPISEEQSKTYTRSKNGSTKNDPQVGQQREKTEKFEYTDTGSKHVKTYREITSVEQAKANAMFFDKVDIAYKYIVYQETTTVTDEKTIVATPGSSTYALNRLTFNRELYKPNEIVADIFFTQHPSSTELDNLLGKRVTLDRYIKDTSSTDDPILQETFTGFYIYDIIPLKINNESLYVRFHIFSYDHQLTLRKYSRTYVAKKLLGDILLEGIIDSTQSYNATYPAYNTCPVVLKLPFNTYYLDNSGDVKDATKKTITRDNILAPLDQLHYVVESKEKVSDDDNKEYDVTTTYERILSYLVQYNESFYSFIARTANRCGEFLFWDDGTLRLGRSCETKNLDNTIDDSDCLTRYYASAHNPSELETKYMTVDDENLSLKSVPDLNKDIDKDWKNPAESNSDWVCNSDINHNIYNTRIFEDRFASTDDQRIISGAMYGLSFLSTILNETTLYDALKKIALGEIIGWSAAAAEAEALNKLGKELSFDKDTKEHLTERKHTADSSSSSSSSSSSDEQKEQKKLEESTYIHPFSSVFKEGLVDDTFYDKIRTNEERQTKSLITFNLSTAKKMRLGQTVTYNSKSYVIIQIKMQSVENGSQFSAIDPQAEAPFALLGSTAMQVVAVPCGDTVYPPLAVDHVRRCQPQIAFVSDAIDPQKRGRVRIKYPWQNSNKDSEASPWIHVLTPSSAKEGGVSFTLTPGEEVLIDYHAGNVERPYVAGTIFNKSNTTPYLRGTSALVSRNGHAIGFSDPLDSTRFLAGMSPSYQFISQFFPFPVEVGGPNELKLTGGITMSDAYGFYKIQMSTDQRRIDISSPFGSVNLNAFTGITISAPNGDINIKGQNVNIEAGNAVKITSGLNIKKKGYLGFIAGDEDGKAAAFGSGLLDSLFGIFGDSLKTGLELVDLDLLRKLIEVFLRPIDGTLEIHSHKYLLLEAGKGEATVRTSRYKANKLRDGSSHLDTATFSEDTRKNLEPTKCINGHMGAIDRINNLVETLLEPIKGLRRDFDTARTTYGNTLTAVLPTFNLQPNENIKSGNDIVTEQQNADQPTQYAKADLGIPDRIDVNADAFKNSFDTLKDSANDLATKAHHLLHLGTTIPDDATMIPLAQVAGNDATKYYPIISAKAHNTLTAVLNPVTDWKIITDQQVDDLKVLAKKTWFANVFGDNSNTNFNTNGTTLQADGSNWGAFIDAICATPIPPTDFKDKVADSAITNMTAFLTQYRDTWNETFRDRNHWDAAADGQIIYSDQEHVSYYYDLNGTRQAYSNGTDNDFTILALQRKLRGWV